MVLLAFYAKLALLASISIPVLGKHTAKPKSRRVSPKTVIAGSADSNAILSQKLISECSKIVPPSFEDLLLKDNEIFNVARETKPQMGVILKLGALSASMCGEVRKTFHAIDKVLACPDASGGEQKPIRGLTMFWQYIVHHRSTPDVQLFLDYVLQGLESTIDQCKRAQRIKGHTALAHNKLARPSSYRTEWSANGQAWGDDQNASERLRPILTGSKIFERIESVRSPLVQCQKALIAYRNAPETFGLGDTKGALASPPTSSGLVPDYLTCKYKHFPNLIQMLNEIFEDTFAGDGVQPLKVHSLRE